MVLFERKKRRENFKAVTSCKGQQQSTFDHERSVFLLSIKINSCVTTNGTVGLVKRMMFFFLQWIRQHTVINHILKKSVFSIRRRPKRHIQTVTATCRWQYLQLSNTYSWWIDVYSFIIFFSTQNIKRKRDDREEEERKKKTIHCMRMYVMKFESTFSI